MRCVGIVLNGQLEESNLYSWQQSELIWGVWKLAGILAECVKYPLRDCSFYLPAAKCDHMSGQTSKVEVEVISTTSRQVSDLTICRTHCFSLHELLWWWQNLPFGARDGNGFLKETEPSCKGSYVIEKQTCYLTHRFLFFLVLLVCF